MGLKDLYYGMEDKYYEVIEKISETIPINKLIDPIDKIVPSFMVFSGLIIFLILIALALMYSGNLGEEKNLSFKLIDENKKAIGNTEIKVFFNDKNITVKTDAFGGTSKDKIVVPLNSTVSYSIDAQGFLKTNDQFKFTEEKTYEITLKKETVQGKEIERTIRLYDSSNSTELISNRTYTISFSCSNSAATPPSNITISNGKGTVFEPANCGILTANIEGDHSESKHIALSDLINSIYLDSLVSNYNLTVNVENTEGEALDDIKIKIYRVYDDNPNPVFADSLITSYGRAEFELEAGEYEIKAFDEINGLYYEKSKNLYNFSSNQSVSLSMERIGPLGGKISITAIDKDTEFELPETKVTLYDSDGIIAEERTTDETGTVEFNLRNKDGLYEAVLDNELYLVQRVTELETEKSYTIELTKFTGQNSGALKVRAITVSGEKVKPVRNAMIALYSVEDEEIFLTGLSEKITDENGSAKFQRIENGKYKIFAYKGTSSGWSDEIQYDKRNASEIELTATMIIPDGFIDLQIVDQENNSIPFATVTFFETGAVKELNSYKTDSDGNISFTTKADKKVFFKVSAPDFMDYYSLSYPIFGNETVFKTIKMIPEKTMDKPEINLTGLFTDGQELSEASSLERGQEYTAKLQLIIPKNKNYDSAGIHFRVGNDVYMENDLLLIKTINAANAVTEKYTMFDSGNLNDSKKSQTQGDAKWFNSYWFVPKPGVYNIETVIFVKENALVGQELNLKFRAYGKTGGKYDRDPEDVEVSYSEELNAATKTKTYTIGTNVLCSENFCFTARIKDKEEDLIESVTNSSYSTKILREYELWFDIMNNNETRKHYEARIQLSNENEMLNFTNYEIKNADALTKKGFADATETKWIELGDFDPNTHVTGTVNFITQKAEPGSILIQIVSSQEIVFEKDISLDVKAPKTFSMEIKPEIIPAITPNTVEFNVTDEETGIEVENAEIKVLDRFNDLIAGPIMTNKTGKAILVIPGQAPDTTLTIRASKKEFEVLEQELPVSGKIVEITPEKIGLLLNTQKNPSDIFGLKIKNLLDFDLELTSIKFTGNPRGLLDLDAMEAWAETNHGNKIIPSKLFEEIEIKAILTDYAIERGERDIVDLTLELEFSNGEAVWTEEIPARISIGVGGEVDDPNCLSLETKEWKTGTEGQKVQVDLSIENSCTIDGKPVDLKDLEAKVNWKTNHVGRYSLAFEDTAIELRSAYYRKMDSTIKNGISTAVLSFEPNGGVNGEAIADIELRARNELEGKDEFISDVISTEIKIINLEDCIKISPTELKIRKGETAAFKVETLGCGSTIEFTLNPEVKVSQERFSLGSQASQEIIVDSAGEYSGRFLIGVQAKGNELQTKNELLNVFVTIFEDSCVELSRYEFDIYDDPNQLYDGYDTAQLFNRCPEKLVDITVDMQDWSLAMRKALLPTVIAFGATTVFGGDEEKNNELSQTTVKIPKPVEMNDYDMDSEDPMQIKYNETPAEVSSQQSQPINKGAFGWIRENSKAQKQELIITEGINDKPTVAENNDNEPIIVEEVGETVSAKESIPATGMSIIPGLDGINNLLGLGNLLPSIFGNINPFTAFGLTFVGATLYNYFEADTISITGIPVEDIVVMDLKLLDGIAYANEKIEVEETGITMNLDGPFSCFDSLTGEVIDCWDITFVNTTGLIQENENTPIMKILKTESIEKFWKKDYDADYFNENKNFFEKLLQGTEMNYEKPLEELTEKRNEINQYNRLQFNSWKYTDDITGDQGYGSCRLGELNGETGEQALPKIKLDWRWNKIDSDQCDQGNSDYIYCDATQFSIELLKKINELTDLLEQEQLICSDDCSTLNVSSLIQKTEEERGATANKEKITELINFRSYLIQDGYSTDFQEDFHDYAVNEAFFETPIYYYSPEENDKLGEYFKDKELFDFEYDGSPNAPLSAPGLYKVFIEIEYNDNSWKLFKGSNPNAKIIIRLDKLEAAKPTSPLYYLPFDGEIGINTSNGRIDYGIDYVNKVGGEININDTKRAITTTPIPVAVPIQTLETYYETDFKKTNIDQRGKIMEFQRKANSTTLIYSPSKPTPVLLETRRTNETAQETEYVFYEITVNGQAQNTGSNGITKWTGIDPNCRDFEDKSSLKYQETLDIHGLSNEAKNGVITGDKAFAYGWVWSNPIKTGKFWLETLIFSPLDSVTNMYLVSSSNKVILYTPINETTIEGNSNGTNFVPLNGVLSTKITSLQKILDLVKTEDICVGGLDNSSYTYFFWNPEKVDDPINEKKQGLDAAEQCIKS
ncbi:MAG: hypothetical protein COT90_05385 [Candidatus Diapherotrites archaeon CG10_big_fil_rev_8_21_14_0_10_31_34]|nr:MAG: hypothetical protein COT90_05385 [Candidatus Diapherotrites archaeon CG10_big_fil_rev_8_21_14_0_10_31_34]